MDEIKKRVPAFVETRDQGMVYDAASNLWYPAYQSVFRPIPGSAVISLFAVGSYVIIPAVQNKVIRICSMFFTVKGEVNITFYDGSTPISGPMDFGGDGEPRGIVIPIPYSPDGVFSESGFIIDVADDTDSGQDIQVSGKISYFRM